MRRNNRNGYEMIDKGGKVQKRIQKDIKGYKQQKRLQKDLKCT